MNNSHKIPREMLMVLVKPVLAEILTMFYLSVSDATIRGLIGSFVNSWLRTGLSEATDGHIADQTPYWRPSVLFQGSQVCVDFLSVD